MDITDTTFTLMRFKQCYFLLLLKINLI